jgi:DNA invertase Pin-like site-specific DNA recombinase
VHPKTEVANNLGSAKRAVIYARVSTGDQHAETQLYDLRLATQRRYEIVRRAPLDVDRAAIVQDRLTGLSLTKVAKKHRVSRATVCRLVNESGGLKKTGVPQLRKASVIPLDDGSNSLVAA